MSHILWKYYWENDVDKFRRLLAPAGYNPHAASRSPGIGTGQLGASPGGYGTSPRATKSRKASGHGTNFGNAKGAYTALGKSEINSRDHVGLTVLLRAASSTNPNAILFIQALLDHPSLDLYAQDRESGWNALHRALYSGNISIARLLLEKERRNLTEQTLGSAVNKVGLLIKTKDHEGNSPFDVYHSTIAVRSLKDLERPDGSDSGSESEESSTADQLLAKSTSGLEALGGGEEFFVFGSNKNLSLGVGDEDDRQYPERVFLSRPDHLFYKFYEDHLRKTRPDSTGPSPISRNLQDIPALIKNRPIMIHDAMMSKLHTAVLTTDPVSNMYVCGVGRGGRLGLGDENTQFRFVPVQGGLIDKKVVNIALGQNHTMAVTDNGELWTWGSNLNSQLGYLLPPPVRKEEEPISTTPRQVFGTLKKEVIIGIAASAVHSVAHTRSSLYCWGKNVGQLALMDADSRSLETQQTPRKVAASLFSSNILAVSAIDKATTCLLYDNTICVFTSYGYNFVKFPAPDVFVNHQFNATSMSTRYDSSRNWISSITSGGETIAAVTTRGDLFTMALNHKVDSIPSATSTTNPAKIKGALTQPQCIWSAKKDGVKSVSIGEHGSVIICTESGAVWRRVKRAKAKDASLSGSADTRRKDFKFQRVPSVTNVVAVRSSTFGAFAAIRKDCEVMKDQINIDDQSLWDNFAPLLMLRDFKASEPRSGDKDTLKFWKADVLKDKLGVLPYELLKSPDLDADLQQYLRLCSYRYPDLDVELCTSSSPEIRIPVHGWLLAARSSVLRCALAEYRAEQEYEMPEVFQIEEVGEKILVTFQSLDVISLVNLIVYCYDDNVVPVWNYTRQAPPLAYRYRQIRVELMKLATKLNMMKLEAAVRLQIGSEKSLDKDMKLAIRDPEFFEDADAVVELDGADYPVHSQLLCQRCAFFEGLFHGRSQGMWLASRRDAMDADDQVRVDLKHIDPESFNYVLQFLYADVGAELFDGVKSSDIDGFSDLVMDVMSIANELMLDRLSQICQFVIGRFVTTRNISLLLNEISPCAVTEFKVAGLEYVCLQMEAMLENHLLDALDEDLVEELDEVVRENQLSRYPFVRSGRAELLLLDKYPDLAVDIDEERQRRVREMAFKAAQKDDDRKLSSSFRARFGSLDDFPPVSPTPERSRRKSKAGRNEPFSPRLRPKESHGDLMFDMDEEESSAIDTPEQSPSQKALDVRGQLDLDKLPLLSNPWSSTNKQEADRSVHSPVSSPLMDRLTSHVPAPSSPSKDTGKVKGAGDGNPWGLAVLTASRMDLRDALTRTPPKSALSASLAAQKGKDTVPRVAQPKLSQKERKKQQQHMQEVTKIVSSAEAQQTKVAWDKEKTESKEAPWKLASGGPKTSLRDAMKADLASPVVAAPVSGKPLLSVDESPRSAPRRTASPDTRFSGQARVSNSPAHPTPSTPRPTAKPLVPHSKSYMAPTPKAELSLGLSMADIIGQQKREQEIVREAVAKRSLQEIQQEQAFQEWWNEESRRTQEEEARKVAREKERDDRGPKEGRRGRRGGRGGRGRGGGGAGVADGGGELGGAPPAAAAGPSDHPRGKFGRGRGGRAPVS